MTDESVVLQISGRLQGTHLTELRHALRTEGLDENCVLNLKELRLVDRDAVRFLADCQARGAKLLNCPAYVSEWIAKENEL